MFDVLSVDASVRSRVSYGGTAQQIFPQFLGDGTTIIQWNPIPLNSQGSNVRTHSGFFNDSWRVGDRLTLIGGLRYTDSSKEFHYGRFGVPGSATGGATPPAVAGIPGMIVALVSAPASKHRRTRTSSVRIKRLRTERIVVVDGQQHGVGVGVRGVEPCVAELETEAVVLVVPDPLGHLDAIRARGQRGQLRSPPHQIHSQDNPTSLVCPGSRAPPGVPPTRGTPR